jgi:hypothetical protein
MTAIGHGSRTANTDAAHARADASKRNLSNRSFISKILVNISAPPP